MTRRLIAGPLWFVAVSSLVTFVETLISQPSALGAILGVAVAAFVMFDPLNKVWPTRLARTDRASLQIVGAERLG
jgi:hypothetical protein